MITQELETGRARGNQAPEIADMQIITIEELDGKRERYHTGTPIALTKAWKSE